MALTKKQREALKPMFGGRCAYCGCELGDKWHADHVEPIFRKSEVVPRLERKDPMRFEVRHTGESQNPHLDAVHNYFPACIPCNLFKSVFSVEGFRKEIEAQIERGRKSSVNFRTAERFGLIQEVQKPVVFWFEQYQKKAGAA